MRETKRPRSGGSRQAQGMQYAKELAAREVVQYKWRRYFETLALGRIKWTDLPDSCDARFLEKTLLHSGVAVFYNSFDVLDTEPLILSTCVVLEGPLDLYDNYTEMRSIGNGGHDERIRPGEGVLIWDSRSRAPFMPSLYEIIDQLVDLEMLQIKNRKQQSWTKLLLFNELAQADATVIQRALDTGEPYVKMVKGVDITTADIDMSVPYLVTQFNEDATNLMNRAYALLGIKHIPFEKSQYMKEGEWSVADDSIARVRDDLLSQRREAAEKANEKWGLDIKVDWQEENYFAQENEPSNGAKMLDGDITMEQGDSND